MPKSSSRIGWLIPGQMLLINGQILPIWDCQIVLSRRASSRQYAKLEQDDRVPVVEFWLNRPVQGATAYIPVIQSGKVVLTQVNQMEQIQNWNDVQWLVIVSGDIAIAVRRLILQLAQQNTPNPPAPRQAKHAPPVSKPIPTADAQKYKLIVKNQPKPHRVDVNVLDFIDPDLLDLDDE
ncbi:MULTISPECIES: hypothetical protein [Leptolyngbya]|uniref:hypothetical protein n=1 Tax=Leptolyngbya TaxID=47251 RepID=UPI001682DE28|nr:hypothetical protein [Leptolyngbya sp. FACHB-1624]MBD1858642.1 hypothetical protein [Leptolyngbya sp. FACHB-1624]